MNIDQITDTSDFGGVCYLEADSGKASSGWRELPEGYNKEVFRFFVTKFLRMTHYW